MVVAGTTSSATCGGGWAEKVFNNHVIISGEGTANPAVSMCTTGTEYQCPNNNNKNCITSYKKSEKHWGPRRNGGGKVVGVVHTRN